MPLPPRDFGKIGPNEGEHVPDVVLPDQTGRVVDLHAARPQGHRGLLPQRRVVTLLQDATRAAAAGVSDSGGEERGTLRHQV
jgi:hypothetical protein